MPAFFNLTLDTLGTTGTLVIGTGAAYVNNADVILNISHEGTDIVQMKIWGDVDPNVNTDIQETELTSAWITYSATQAIKLSPEDGSKTIYCKLRDNVLNEGSEFSATVTLDQTIPTVTIVSGPTPNKISKIPSKNTSEFTFQCSEIFSEYKVTVVASESSSQAVATTIGSAHGSTNMTGDAGNYPSSTPISCTISGADLEEASPGDGTKIVKVFVKDLAGNWSL